MIRKAIYTTENEAALIESGRGWNFHDADTREHLHALHPYPAKFIPQIPRKAILTWTKPGQLVYDPFCGCGTTLLEASLHGRRSVGTDNNSVATLVSRAKTTQYSRSDLQRIDDFSNYVRDNLSKLKPQKHLIPDNTNFLYWFQPDILDRLSTLKHVILKQDERIRTLLMAVLSSIIVRVSLQDSDTRYARVQRLIKADDVERLFLNKIAEALKMIREVPIAPRAAAKIFEADARNVPFVKSQSVNFIVTSPPYLNAYDYHKYHRQRIHFIDGDVAFARDMEIGSHDEFTRTNATPAQYFLDMDACFSEWMRVLRSGGRCLILIGDAIVSKKAVHVGDTFVELMQKRGFVLENRWIRELHATKRAFNVRNSRISHEHVLLFKKPAKTLRKVTIKRSSS